MEKKSKKGIKQHLKRLWWFIWESNSPWSWVVNIILAFVIIKFAVYPGLGFALGTTHPVVAVISGSMEHQAGLDDWWDLKSCCTTAECDERISQGTIYFKYLIMKSNFTGYRFANGFNKGDLMVLSSADDVKVGDVIVFYVEDRADPIIHRVVGISDNMYRTKGDNNCGSASFEQNISPEMVIGRAALRIPLLGWIKIGFMNLLNIAGIGA